MKSEIYACIYVEHSMTRNTVVACVEKKFRFFILTLSTFIYAG